MEHEIDKHPREIVVNTYIFTLTGQDIIRAGDLITGGKSLMKYIVNRYETQLRKVVTDKGDTLVKDGGKETNELSTIQPLSWIKQETESVLKCSLAKK